MVNRLKRAYSKGPFIFISSDLQYKKIKIDAIGPCYLGSKGLQQACNKLELNKVVGEASGKLRFVQELEIW